MEFLIGRMLPYEARGQSGTRLVKAAWQIEHAAVVEVVDGYERMLPDRNHVIRGTYQVFEDYIVAWNLRQGGEQLTSPYSVELLELIATSWGNLAEAARRALHFLIDGDNAEATA